MKADTEMRANYQRSDFVKLERGKFFDETVIEALRGLLGLADETSRIAGRSKQPTRKRAAVSFNVRPRNPQSR